MSNIDPHLSIVSLHDEVRIVVAAARRRRNDVIADLLAAAFKCCLRALTGKRPKSRADNSRAAVELVSTP